MTDKYRVINAPEVNLRSGPGTTFKILKGIHRDAIGIWQESHMDCANYFMWHRLTFGGTDQFDGLTTGWMRSDYLQLVAPAGNSGTITVVDQSTPFVMPRSSSFPLPCGGTFEGGWGAYGGSHKGWDISNRQGTLIFAQPGGIVHQTEKCTKCDGPEGPSSYGNGVPVYQIYRDRGWNGGYGHYVVMRYPSALLPARTQAQFPNLDAFVMYAHLSKITCSVGQQVGDNFSFVIGEMGNTGNSSGSHLHIELKFAPASEKRGWSYLPAPVDPGVMFIR